MLCESVRHSLFAGCADRCVLRRRRCGDVTRLFRAISLFLTNIPVEREVLGEGPETQRMSLRWFAPAIACLVAPLAIGQAQLQFVAPLFGPAANRNYSYKRALPLPNGDTLLVGTETVTTRIGIPVNPVTHLQIALAAIGPVTFQNGEPPDILPVLGGSGNDVPEAAAVDPGGNIWIAGTTDSDDFNVVNPIVAQKAPYRQAAFVLELDPTGTKLLFATYLAAPWSSLAASDTNVSGSFYGTSASALAVDARGNVYVGGSTNEPDFPTTPGAYMTKSGPGADIFGDTFIYSWLAKISPDGKLVYSTFVGTGQSSCFGGSSCIGHQSTSASVSSIAVDNSGAGTLAGVKGGSFNYGSGYVARVAPDGSKLLWSSTVSGGHDGVAALLMVQDSSGNVDVFGQYLIVVTHGVNLPPASETPGLFVERLSPDGSTVVSSLDLGQAPDATAAGIALDPSGDVYVAGTSSSTDFPTVTGVPNPGSDFILGLDSSGTKAKTLIRLPRGTVSEPFAFDTSGRILLPGSTGMLLTISPEHLFDSPGIVAISNSASYDLDRGITPGELITLFGFDFGQNPQVLIGDRPAKVLYAGASQINVQAPFELSMGMSSRIEVQSETGTTQVNSTPPAEGSIGIFTTDGVHAAALNQDGSVNSAANPAAYGSVITLFGTGAVWPPGIQDGSVASSAAPFDPAWNRFEVFDATGTPLTILYAGAAPGLIYGVFQMNVQLPGRVYLPLTLRSTQPDGAIVASNPVQIFIK